jgi:hypothetical protein
MRRRIRRSEYVRRAYKAWETKRSNERHEDYVARARKAWRTKRRNERQEAAL